MSTRLLFERALHIRSAHGVGLMRQLAEATRLRFGASKLDPWEYYFFGLFAQRYSMREKQRFAGWRRELILDRRANAGADREAANNKVEFHQRMAAAGAPMPKLLAVYQHGDAAPPDGAVLLRDEYSAAEFLADARHRPVCIKPLRGSRGRGVQIVRDDTDIRQVLASFSSRGGFIVQEVLRTAPALASVCGDRLTSARLIVARTDAGPEILSAVWRVPTGNNVIDNFSVGVTGNLIGAIDIGNGAVGTVYQGIGWDTAEVAAHPDTGARFEALRLPGWDQAIELCRRHSAGFPGLKLQHWDIALTDRGPVFIEVNVEGGFRTHQIVRQCGIVDDRLERL